MQGGLRTVFDASAVTYSAWPGILFPLGAALVAIWLYKTGRRPLYWKIAAGLAVLLVGLAIIFPWLDLRHVKSAAASGAVQTVDGLVSQHKRWKEKKFDGWSKGVGVTTTTRYRMTTYEYFYVGDQFFSYVVGGYSSPASFTNTGDPPVPISDGMRARVTYFADSWNNGDKRIVKLELGPGTGAPIATGGAAALAVMVAPSGKSAGSGASDLPADFAAFRDRFAAAMTSGDQVAAKEMVNFPFLFGGHTLEADEFDSLWMSLFSQPLRPCLAMARPVLEGDRYSMFCGPYGYYFARTPKGWKLVEFGTDGEAQ